ncbi:Uncharacterized protein BP5553_06952 [Venustampulla echinocandica]|uniref:Conserved oligomeric Golgi complex subunit 1 n=1 Tax=Venustampulla echinocandica TaxID=2656787 RepID=A0A370TI36_9HELO|nr:Uncharacterized protein BP5553_06952 [Venustampulla echinocandica]RDL35021.1 Uncharacterized protein BP5553_06952 [Venustampulla echinocandica]
MAATKTLDAATCTTAAEAFKHPLPQVRQFHRTLTTELDEKNARLRTLVGGSYRQLLGTAEMILEMRENIDIVEDTLGNVGKGCGRGVIGGMASGLGKLVSAGGGVGDKHRRDLEWAARMKVLSMCGVTVGKLLKRGVSNGGEGRTKNLVLAAKVLALNKLLVKTARDSVAERSTSEQELVGDAKKKLASLQSRLLRAIKKSLQRTDGDASREDLIQALSAYSLATNSGAKDVLRHFLRARGEALELAFEDEGEASCVVRALELYTRTLLDVQAMVPRRLSEALAALKDKVLLKDEKIREIEGLRLNVCEKWLGDEILFFMPYIRHDDLAGPLAVETLRGWSKKASEVLLQGFAATLERVQDFKIVVDLRTKILQIWIKEGGQAKGFDPSILLDGLRKVINDRMVHLLESRVQKLHLVATEVEGTLGLWDESIAGRHESLWDASMLDMEINQGADPFKQAILARTHGRNDAVSRVFKGYQAWRKLVDEITVVIEQLKKQRWDDDLEDIEDDDVLESRNTLLSREDPEMLQGRFNTCLENAYKGLHEKIAALIAVYENSEHAGSMSIYLLRIIRDLRTGLPRDQALQSFGLSLVPALHEKLASTVSVEPIKSFTKSFEKKSVAGRALWEGTPELPVQPSPAAFKLLNNLTIAMSNLGADLWSPTAIGVLKRKIRKELAQAWLDVLKAPEEKEDSPETNGAVTNGDASPSSPNHEVVDVAKWKEYLTQSLFDLVLLQNSFELPDTEDGDDDLQPLEETIKKQIDLDPAAQKRLKLAAKEYWTRTSLLFRLLA